MSLTKHHASLARRRWAPVYLTALGLVALCGVVTAACSANSSDNKFSPGATGGSGGTDNDASIINEDVLSTGGSGGTAIVFDAPVGETTLSDGGECIGLKVAAEPYPLDMYVMMDQSGSMKAEVNLAGKTQWTAIKEAFIGFLGQSGITGLGMGIQYFPLLIDPWDTFTACSESNPTCPADHACYKMDTGDFCMKECSGTCANGAECIPPDEPDAGVSDYCNNDDCNAARYATPDVEIADLPGNSQALTTSLNAHGPLTMTPSSPALQGAIDHAKKWATDHPNRTTVVVFATDGLPTVCLGSTEVIDVAKAGVQGNPSIKTFVIGVGGMTFTLKDLAVAGGTKKAFMVDTNQDVTKQFTEALNSVRGSMMDCEFKIPQASGVPDYQKVNVDYTSETDQTGPLYYVGDASQCDATIGGWYYDVDPAQTTPQKILLCPQNCDFIHAHGGSVSVVVGCKTVTPPPK